MNYTTGNQETTIYESNRIPIEQLHPKTNMDTTNEPRDASQVLENDIDRRNMPCNTNSPKGNTTTDGTCITTLAIQGDAHTTSHMHGPRVNVNSRKRKKNDSPEQPRREPEEKKRENDTLY